MHKFVRNLVTEWRRLKLPFAGETLLVALSGGADSMSLLLAMHDLVLREKLRLRIVAAHFNHGIRGAESDADEEFIKDLTSGRKIELAIGHGHVSGNGNLEQNARNARYDFLCRTALNLNAYAVATGHTINDQAETFLLNLIRGSGPAGLSGMPVIRSLEEEKGRWGDEERGRRGEEEKGRRGEGETIGNGDCESGAEQDDPESPLLPFSSSPLLIRPMLTWAKRRDTEGYCHDSGVEYRYDTMNEDTAFKRVRIRKILLPLLEDMNPNIVETLANTAALLQTSASMASLPTPPDVAGELLIRELKALPKAELYDTVRTWLRHHRGNTRGLGLKHIQSVENLVLSEKSGRTVELPGGQSVVKKNGSIIFVP